MRALNSTPPHFKGVHNLQGSAPLPACMEGEIVHHHNDLAMKVTPFPAWLYRPGGRGGVRVPDHKDIPNIAEQRE